MKIKFSIKDWVSLKPNRDDLLTPSAAWWIFVVRIMITIMATAEGISWGYMGWSIGRNVSPVFAALLCGLFIFSVIWLVDATFMTLDTSLAFYERTIKGNVFSTLDKVKYIAKGFGGVGGRVAIVLGSYMVSAPFLAQLVFSYDIDGRIETLNMAKVAETRTGIVTSHDNKIDNFEKKLDELRASLIEETAGTGPSGIHGDGVVARSIRENISAVESQLDKATAEKEDELNDFAALDLDGIARKYKVEFLKPGIETESRVLTELMQDEKYGLAKQAIRTFLFLLIGGLFILKLFQPKAVRVYYNDCLQDLFKQYQRGLFDTWLHESEIAFGRDGEPNKAGFIEPLRFEEWCLNNYQIFVREDDKNRRSGEIRASYENSIFILKNERTLIRESIGPLKEDLKKAYEEKRQLEHSLRRSVADLERLNQDLTAQGRSMEVIDKQLSSGDIKEEGVFKNTIATKCQLEAAIMDVRERIHQLNDDKSVYAAQLEDKEEEVLSLKDHIQRKEKEETEIEEKISSAKKKYFKELEELNNKGGGPAGIP